MLRTLLIRMVQTYAFPVLSTRYLRM